MDIEQITSKLKKLKKENTSKVLFQHSFPLNLDLDKILAHVTIQKEILYMRFPKGEKTYLGFGRALEYNIHSKNELEKLQNETSNKKNLLFFGATSFNIHKISKSPWDEIPNGYFFIPEVLLTVTKENTTFTFTKVLNKTFAIQTVLNKISECLSLLQHSKMDKKNDKRVRLSNKQLIPEKNDYIESVQTILKKIHRGQIDKVVLSRIERFDIQNNLSFKTIIDELAEKYPNCLNFIIEYKEGEYFMGSSPEVLITINDNKFKTIALAGTSKQSLSLKNKKEIEEHQYVVDYLKKTLDEFSYKLNVDRDAKPLKLDYAYHIRTPIHGILIKKIHILKILTRIYPTPALAGYPRNESMELIDSNENFDRGWYGGSIGIFNTNGDGNFYVPIRSALIKNSKIYFYSGSGIVGKSNAEKEWQETKLKLQHLQSIFI